jgi:hypothetical protein
VLLLWYGCRMRRQIDVKGMLLKKSEKGVDDSVMHPNG